MKGGNVIRRDPEGDGRSSPSDVRGAGNWPGWAKGLVSLVLLYHIVAILAGALAANPSSPLERSIAGLFAAYHQWIDQGYSYRYYAPEPGPTAIVTAQIRFGDGKPEKTIRLPERGARPKLLYQRQLALANHLTEDVRIAHAMTGQGGQSRWARSYARHLAKEFPGSTEISLFLQTHLIPDPERVRQELAAPGATGVNLDDDEYFTTPERIGDYPCNAF